MDSRSLAEEWVNSTFRENFRFGFLTYDAREADRLAARRLPRGQSKFSERIYPRFSQFNDQLLKRLAGGEISIEQARAEIEAVGLSRYIKVAGTKEELISGIATIRDDGANVWSEHGEDAWGEVGTFVCVFWHDPSHD